MVELYRNVDLVQVNITAGIDEYQIRQNVAWENRKIEKIVLCAPTSTDCLSPIDGVTHVLAASEIDNLYFDIYNSNSVEIAHNCFYTQLLHTNNHPLRINDYLSTQLSRLYFSDAPQTDGCLLLYVFYGTQEKDVYEPSRNNRTITFELAADERITFTDLISRYLHAPGKAVRGIWFKDPANNPAYITLRDHALSYNIYNVHNELMRSQMAGASADDCQIRPFLLDREDMDFDYSYIQNATASAQTHDIVIEY